MSTSAMVADGDSDTEELEVDSLDPEDGEDCKLDMGGTYTGIRTDRCMKDESPVLRRHALTARA